MGATGEIKNMRHVLGARTGLSVVVYLCVVSGMVWGASVPLVPNPELTVGELCKAKDKDFDEFRYDEGIAHCKRNVSKSRRDAIYAKYKISSRCRNHFTIDHFIPLSMGGNNRNENLWPEHKAIKAVRFDLEYDVYMELRRGRITQKEAIAAIRKEKLHPPEDEVRKEMEGFPDCGPLEDFK